MWTGLDVCSWPTCIRRSLEAALGEDGGYDHETSATDLGPVAHSDVVMEHRRSWTSTVDGVDHRIDVVYRALTGWMEIEVDGARQARGWREWQTVVGGANLSCVIGGHRVDARVTQPFGRQAYAFALKIDGQLQPGSDPQLEPQALKRQTLVALGALALTIFVVTTLTTIFRTLT